jgi:D-amino-acid dehydrogenase
MKIAVIGAGIVGIATAYELANDGHEVSVFEKNSMAAEEASFANAGLIAPSQLIPLSSPAWPSTSMMQVLRRQSRLDIHGMPSLRDLKWRWKWNRSLKSEDFLANFASTQSLITYSQARIHEISAGATLEYERSDGQLVLLHSEADRKSIQPLLAHLKETGVVAKDLSAEEARKMEPALSASAPIDSAVYFPNDEVGNCRQFGLLLKGEATKLGVQFNFSTEATAIEAAPNIALRTRDGAVTQAFDGIVVCAGQLSHRLLSPLGIKLPLTAAYGYTISAAIGEPLNAPRSAVLDLQKRISISRLGNRIRVSGGAEMGDNAGSKNTKIVEGLYRALQQYFPGAARYPSGTQVWKGARTLATDGLPLIGASQIPGIWLNLGHGANGWGMSCGSARVLADVIQRKQPDIDPIRLDPTRFAA